MSPMCSTEARRVCICSTSEFENPMPSILSNTVEKATLCIQVRQEGGIEAGEEGGKVGGREREGDNPIRDYYLCTTPTQSSHGLERGLSS